MKVKVAINTDEKGKYFYIKRRKTYIKKKCVSLMPNKNRFNIYIRDDGSKYYNKGGRAVYLGSKTTSKLICDDLDKVLSNKRSKTNKALIKTIDELQSIKRSQKDGKRNIQWEIAKTAKIVIDKKREEKKERDKEKKGRASAKFVGVKASLEFMTQRRQAIKTEARGLGWDRIEEGRALREFDAFITNPRTNMPTPALGVLYNKDPNFLKVDNNGIPILPKSSVPYPPIPSAKAIAEPDDADPFGDIPEYDDIDEIMMATPVSHKKRMNSKGRLYESDDSDDEVIPSSTPVDLLAEPTDPTELVEPADPIAVRPLEEKAEDPPARKGRGKNKKPTSALTEKRDEALRSAQEEITDRLRRITSYFEDDVADINDVSGHKDLINEITGGEKIEGLNIKHLITPMKARAIKDLKTYGKSFIAKFIKNTQNSDVFDITTLKNYGLSSQVKAFKKGEGVLPPEGDVSNEINDYDTLNKTIDYWKKKEGFRKKAVSRGIRLMEDKLNGYLDDDDTSSFVDYSSEIIKRFTKDKDGKKVSKIPTQISNIFADAKLEEEDTFKARSSKLGITSIVGGLEQEEHYWNNPVLDHEVLGTISTNLKKKFTTTQTGLFDDESISRAFEGDDFDVAVGMPSASGDTALGMLETGGQHKISTAPEHKAVATDEGKLIDESKSENEDE